jgi:hypothetical protein
MWRPPLIFLLAWLFCCALRPGPPGLLPDRSGHVRKDRRAKRAVTVVAVIVLRRQPSLESCRKGIYRMSHQKNDRSAHHPLTLHAQMHHVAITTYRRILPCSAPMKAMSVILESSRRDLSNRRIFSLIGAPFTKRFC